MSVYDIITERVIAEMEKGEIPWNKPWFGVRGSWSRCNGKRYSLCNQLHLPHGEYATFGQIVKEGGHINKGEKGYPIFYYSVRKEKDENGEIKYGKPVFRYYTVFNIEEQTDLELKYKDRKVKEFNNEPIQACENAFNHYTTTEGVKVVMSSGDEASYTPTSDTIRLPYLKNHTSSESFYSTAFHEAAHSTGHSKRLARDLKHMGTESYSKEELVAELTSAAILHRFGVETTNTFKNSTAYLESWLSHLKNDKTLLVQASSKADKAVKMILGEEE